MTPSRESFQSVGAFSSLTKSGRIPSQTTTTTWRSNLAGSVATPVACEHKSNATTEIDVQYSQTMFMIAGRLRRRRGERQSNPFPEIGRVRPARAGLALGAPLWNILFAAVFLPTSAWAAPLIPTATGMAWQYNMAEELGKPFSVPDVNPDASGKIHLPVLYRIAGTQNVDGKELLKFEMHRSGVVTNTDLLTVDERGILCSARINLDGEWIQFNPPQAIIATPLTQGASWNCDGQAGDLKVHQHYDVTGEEDVDVPAGKFHAFRIHGVQTSPSPMTVDRWFATGTGIVKDVTTTRATNGDLRQRISLELAERPKIVNRPEVKPDAAPKKISVSFARERFGKATTTFSSETSQIFARWQGHRLTKGARVRVVWIAENIGEDFPPDYKVDESSAIAEGPTSHGAFTLSRPDDGWALGDYRVEFYVDDVLFETVKLKLLK